MAFSTSLWTLLVSSNSNSQKKLLHAVMLSVRLTTQIDQTFYSTSRNRKKKESRIKMMDTHESYGRILIVKLDFMFGEVIREFFQHSLSYSDWGIGLRNHKMLSKFLLSWFFFLVILKFKSMVL